MTLTRSTRQAQAMQLNVQPAEHPTVNDARRSEGGVRLLFEHRPKVRDAGVDGRLEWYKCGI